MKDENRQNNILIAIAVLFGGIVVIWGSFMSFLPGLLFMFFSHPNPIEIAASARTATPIPFITHTPIKINDFNLKSIWSINDVNVSDRGTIMLGADQEKTCYIGHFGKELEPSRESLICINSNNGLVLWQLEMVKFAESLSVTSNGIFFPYSKEGVIKLDIQNGDFVWQKHLDCCFIHSFYVLDDQIQTSDDHNFWILNMDGGVIKKTGDNHIKVIQPDMTFKIWDGLEAFKTVTDELLWTQPEIYTRYPLIFTKTKGEIFLKSQNTTAIALNRETGKTLWESSPVIGNIVYSSFTNRVYALLESGDLIAYDGDSGKATTMVSFSSVPFLVFGDGISSYQMAYDQKEHVLSIAIGDSKQLFGFKEK